MPSRVALSVLAALLLLAGCDLGGDTKTVTERETVTETAPTGSVPEAAPAVVPVFVLRGGKVAPVARSVVADSGELPAAALEELLNAPTAEEETLLGAVTAIPARTEAGGVTVDGGIADVELSRTIDAAAQAQVVYTLTAFPEIKRVRFLVEGEPQGPAEGRGSFEAQTPAILVLSPLPGEEVEPGFVASGTANTFEANFQYELRSAADQVLADSFVTATSGSGTRGTFEFPVEYEVDSPQDGRLVVFELSAADGSRTNEISIPLRLR